MKNMFKFLNSDIKTLFKWFRVETEPGFFYVSLYYFGLYIKNTEISYISFSEEIKGIKVGKYFIRVF